MVSDPLRDLSERLWKLSELSFASLFAQVSDPGFWHPTAASASRAAGRWEFSEPPLCKRWVLSEPPTPVSDPVFDALRALSEQLWSSASDMVTV